jgi:hypothetical protein
MISEIWGRWGLHSQDLDEVTVVGVVEGVAHELVADR